MVSCERGQHVHACLLLSCESIILFPEMQRDLFMLLTFKEKFTVGQLFLEVR
jgi:hypothetical protein